MGHRGHGGKLEETKMSLKMSCTGSRSYEDFETPEAPVLSAEDARCAFGLRASV